ncbi:MAG: hypothetical protein E7Z65_06245 [Thermoplasmata archaeon]|nr:hypothetical protein [Thermoplasmata archaeon]
MNEIDERILGLIKEHTRLSVPQLIDNLYPDVPVYRKSTLRTYIYGKCKNLSLYHYLRKVREGNAVLWELEE